jgi:hypothetical protein
MQDTDTEGLAGCPKREDAATLGKVASAPLADAGRAHTVRDGVAEGTVLVEALRSGAFDVERANAARLAIEERAARVRAGDLTDIERDLVAQGAWLDALIEWALARGTAPGLRPSAAGQWLAVALRAAGLKARTGSALAALVLAQGRIVGGGEGEAQ